MDATCTIQDSIHVFSLVHKYVSRILGTYQNKPYAILTVSPLLKTMQNMNLVFGFFSHVILSLVHFSDVCMLPNSILPNNVNMVKYNH